MSGLEPRRRPRVMTIMYCSAGFMDSMDRWLLEYAREHTSIAIIAGDWDDHRVQPEVIRRYGKSKLVCDLVLSTATLSKEVYFTEPPPPYVHRVVGNTRRLYRATMIHRRQGGPGDHRRIKRKNFIKQLKRKHEKIQ